VVIALDYAAAHDKEIEERIRAMMRRSKGQRRLPRGFSVSCMRFLIDAMFPPQVIDLLEVPQLPRMISFNQLLF
jgi:hypothetical protein